MSTKDTSIYIKNVYHMLAYAFRELRMAEFEDLAGEEFERMHDLFAAILTRGIARLVKQGLYREYVGRIENLSTVRGKIELEGTLRNRIAHMQRISCEYDELSENNLLNQVLKTAAMLLLRHGKLDEKRRMELRRMMPFFSDVDEIDPVAIRWDTVRFQRNSLSYRVLMNVCRLMFSGMLLTTDKGRHKLAKFVDDQHMSRLYEKFILEYYAVECDYVRVSSPQIKWALDDGHGTLLPVMQSDVTLSRGNTVLIIDAKYYSHVMQQSYDTQTIHSSNLYQIFTYVKNKEAELANAGTQHTVAGMLLYARTDETVQPDEIYQMSGNQISVRTLDLNKPFDEIKSQLDGIAEDHFAEAIE
ncbi:MAG: 5-methylcytosine-specific restriction endonuclease system specificity protein McrC [Slackia sp.]|nr:5-methylcytosine-specific restriction endonuclease system specificity protein McrC [Slackia sp.]